MASIDIVCNSGSTCPNHGRVINRITGVSLFGVNEMIAELNTGGGDPETDICPLCRELGEAEESNEARPLARHIREYHPEVPDEIAVHGEPIPI